ncbi:hypothetical protein L915_15611 [Phytophthora nicotianae]|uniref:Uncharacterized protein n=1 Tax=Phytophthora nicotianae TaxID=4792 RepID=W2G809_PHYNI|nr:hypothetical protein L915_15611 [Phytophthora nicotianae]
MSGMTNTLSFPLHLAIVWLLVLTMRLGTRSKSSCLTPVNATATILSGKIYTTFGMAIVVFELISLHANRVVDHATPGGRCLCDCFQEKLDEYKKTVKSRDGKIAVVLDPRA